MVRAIHGIGVAHAVHVLIVVLTTAAGDIQWVVVILVVTNVMRVSMLPDPTSRVMRLGGVLLVVLYTSGGAWGVLLRHMMVVLGPRRLSRS